MVADGLAAVLPLPEDAQSGIPPLNSPIQVIPVIQYTKLKERLIINICSYVLLSKQLKRPVEQSDLVFSSDGKALDAVCILFHGWVNYECCALALEISSQLLGS